MGARCAPAAALLGLRITFHQVAALGWETGVLVVLASGIHHRRGPAVGAYLNGLPLKAWFQAALWAFAVRRRQWRSSVLPATRETERFTLLAVVA